MIQITSIKSGYRLRIKEGKKKSKFYKISEIEADQFLSEFFLLMKYKQKKNYVQLFKKFLSSGT
jgi:hypothetical protein